MVFLVSFKSDPKATKKETIFGIDISEYQDDWIDLKKVKKDKRHVKFVIIRATMGDDRKDDKFQRRIKEVREAGFITGAYHYYDPNENSTKQAENYLSRVKLQKGDFIPIVDLEKLSKIQSTKELRQGLKNWLDIVEKKYGAKPMLYTGYKFYLDYLAKDFSAYPLWVAAYSEEKRETSVVKNCEIHQFSERVSIYGIKDKVDGNDIKKADLYKILLKK